MNANSLDQIYKAHSLRITYAAFQAGTVLALVTNPIPGRLGPSKNMLYKSGSLHLHEKLLGVIICAILSAAILISPPAISLHFS